MTPKEEKKCEQCNGTKSYIYTTTGTVHSKICEYCCPHDQGFWLLKEYYGKDNGKLCCMAGCGFTKEDISSPLPQTEPLQADWEWDWEVELTLARERK